MTPRGESLRDSDFEQNPSQRIRYGLNREMLTPKGGWLRNSDFWLRKSDCKTFTFANEDVNMDKDGKPDGTPFLQVQVEPKPGNMTKAQASPTAWCVAGAKPTLAQARPPSRCAPGAKLVLESTSMFNEASLQAGQLGECLLVLFDTYLRPHAAVDPNTISFALDLCLPPRC